MRMRLIDHSANVSPVNVVVFTAAIFALLPISTDLYLPSLPGLRRDLGITDAQSQLTLSAFVIGFGFAQLLYGPLSDRFGRRVVLLGGIALYATASVACMLSPSVEALIAARALQGVGACSGQVMARAIIRDLYDPMQGARLLAYMTFLFALVPMFAPLIGGYLTVWFGWRANFAFLLGYGLLVFTATWIMLAETNRHLDPTATNPRRFFENSRTIWSNRTFAGYAFCITFSYCGLFAYLSASSFVLLDVLGVAPERYGLWFMLGVSGNVAGALLCSRLTRRFPLTVLLATGATIISLGGLSMIALSLADIAHPLAIMGPMAVYLFGNGIITPVCFAAAVGPFPKLAGTASALLGFTQLVVAAVAGQIVLRLYNGTTFPLAGAVAFFGCAVLVTEIVLVRRRKIKGTE